MDARLLTPDQKLTRFVMSEANLAMLEADPDGLLSVFSPKMRVGSITSNQRLNGNPCSGNIRLLLQRKPRWCHQQGRYSPSFFGMRWDDSIMLTDYFQKGKSINGEHHANLLRQLRKAIKSKWPGKLTKSILFHQDDVPAQVCSCNVHCA